MQIATVREALAAAVRDPIIPKLLAYGYVPDAPVVPCFYVAEYEWNPNFTFGGAYDITFTCRVLVSRGDDKAGQKALDDYLSRDGGQSIPTALRNARGAPGELALDGAAADLMVAPSSGHRLYTVGADTQYYGAEIKVRVVGDNE